MWWLAGYVSVSLVINDVSCQWPRVLRLEFKSFFVLRNTADCTDKSVFVHVLNAKSVMVGYKFKFDFSL